MPAGRALSGSLGPPECPGAGARPALRGR